jgi:hypothetical protein
MMSMSRLLIALTLLPVVVCAAVSFESDARALNRSVNGASSADMLAKIMYPNGGNDTARIYSSIKRSP